MANHSIVIPTRDKLFNISEFLTPTPGNIISAIILAVGFVITVIRFTVGIGSVTNLSDVQPWGMWIGFDLLCGVCLAAGGYFTTVACYIMGMKHFHSAVRPAITTAFLGYAFVVIALLYDLGHPLRLPFMFFFPGTTSVLFEVGLCVATYVSVLLIEFSVAPLEWLSCRYPWLLKIRKIVVKCTIPLTIFGVTLSTLHQSSLGSLYLISPGKVFPLWYSPFMPMFFFVSSMAAGASMVIFEGMLAHRGVHHYMDKTHLREADDVTFSFARAASFILFAYFMLKLIDMLVQANIPYLFTGYGAWWAVEMLGFVLLPALTYAKGARDRNLTLCRIAATNTVVGIVLNRFNVSMIAFNYTLPSAERYFPSIWEICISMFVVTMIVTVYRFIVYNMPVLYEHPDFKGEH
ncbi:sulfate respiration complex protein HmcC [Desulfovibrio desulfuricans]|uniref:sulfate respiration complex protein HmcC n=1 Tax=Desulfovibrio desulfuricans TaxID=876 RepID=UPI0035B04CC0